MALSIFGRSHLQDIVLFAMEMSAVGFVDPNVAQFADISMELLIRGRGSH